MRAGTRPLRWLRRLILRAHKATWQSDPVWQGARENVERLTATRDWAEAFFATSVVYEPLVGELFRSGFVMQLAAHQGDFMTPTMMGAGESDAAREQRGVRALFGMLANDPEHGEATMQEWLAAWTPISVEAANRMQPMWSQVSEKSVRFEDSRAHSVARFEDLLTDIGIQTPQEAHTA